MPVDGVLAGMLARTALERGTFRSAAGRTAPVHDLGPESLPQAEQLTHFARTPRGIELITDHTTSGLLAWQPGPVSRLMALVISCR